MGRSSTADVKNSTKHIEDDWNINGEREDVLGNHLKDQSFRLVHWLSVILSLRRTSQESINLDRKSYMDCSSDTHCMRGESGKETTMVADIEELEQMDAPEIHARRLNAKEVSTPMKGDKF